MPKPKYATRKCLNPDCPNGTFIPKRADAKCCDSICRSRYHFHKNREAIRSKYKESEGLKKADRILKDLFETCKAKKIDFVSSETLTLNHVPFNSAVSIAIDAKSNLKIYWFYEFGIMGVGYNKFKVVKKSDYGKA